ncbi:hypothetical protein [Flavobacterium filum]|uniref:hypothetical protein n=1 Tax=Flavobacterium filum TaxID=370974 RepID=UPI0023EFB778|nr:hypothetical protein [Flavobacterium filum]
MTTLYRFIIITFLLSSCDKATHKFPILDKSATFNDVIKFEQTLNSEQIEINKIISSDSLPHFDSSLPHLIFKRTQGLTIPVYAYYLFTSSDTTLCEVMFDWKNLETETETREGLGQQIIESDEIPTYAQYEIEFENVSEIFDKTYGKHTSIKKHVETRIWVHGLTQIDLMLKKGDWGQSLLRLTTRYK